MNVRHTVQNYFSESLHTASESFLTQPAKHRNNQKARQNLAAIAGTELRAQRVGACGFLPPLSTGVPGTVLGRGSEPALSPHGARGPAEEKVDGWRGGAETREAHGMRGAEGGGSASHGALCPAHGGSAGPAGGRG